jgi:hypothetical protein
MSGFHGKQALKQRQSLKHERDNIQTSAISPSAPNNCVGNIPLRLQLLLQEIAPSAPLESLLPQLLKATHHSHLILRRSKLMLHSGRVMDLLEVTISEHNYMHSCYGSKEKNSCTRTEGWPGVEKYHLPDDSRR